MANNTESEAAVPTEVIEGVSSKKTDEGDKDVSTKEADPNVIELEFHQRWPGYSLMALCSLLNLSAISSVPSEERQEYWVMSMMFGIVTCMLSLFVLLHGRFQLVLNYLDYHKAREGYLEGYILFSFVIWWFAGVGYITQPGGIAYVASNIYFSAWGSLFSCVYTLNEWSTEKDVLSIKEITSISMTLRSWYMHFLSACVVFSSSIQLYGFLVIFDDIEDTAFAIALSLVSLLMSLFFILVHYDFFTRCHVEEGGWTELFSAIFLAIVWTIGIGIFTKEGGIAATMEGNLCYQDPTSAQRGDCTIVLDLTDTSGASSRFQVACEQLPRQVSVWNFGGYQYRELLGVLTSVISPKDPRIQSLLCVLVLPLILLQSSIPLEGRASDEFGPGQRRTRTKRNRRSGGGWVVR
jgi:hypothetical protein